MLPFQKNKQGQVVGIIMKTREPDNKEENNNSHAIDACAKDLIDAIHTKDIKRVAEAIQSAFEILENSDNSEKSSIEPHSYQAQNIAAAKGE